LNGSVAGAIEKEEQTGQERESANDPDDNN
jgi:hypothetical protein